MAAAKRRQQPKPLAPQGSVARVSKAQVRPGCLTALQEIYSTAVPPLYTSVDGFLGALLLVNEQADTAQSLTLWESTAAMDAAGNSDAYRDTMQSIGALFLGAPETCTWKAAVVHLPRELNLKTEDCEENIYN